MTTKKQAKAYEQKRREQLARKVALKRARRARTWRVLGALGVALLIGAVIFWAVRGTDDNAAPSTPGSSPSPTPGSEEPRVDLADGWGASPAPPDPEFAEARTWTVDLTTNQGPITLELDGDAAPQAVAAFVALAGDGFFDQTECHRLVTAGIYVLQCGDPQGTGTGGPSWRYGPIENAPSDDIYPAGTLAMARQGNNGESMGSQFFIVYEESYIPSDAAGGYTVFGTVTDGLAIVEDVAQAGTITGEPDGRPLKSVIISEVSVS